MMDLHKQSEVKYLRGKRPLLLFELLLLFNGVKPGVFIEVSNPQLISNIKGLSKRLGLLFTEENKGYVTRNSKLLKEWGFSTNPAIEDASKFIGYPICCVNAFNKSLSGEVALVREVYWYYNLVARSAEELINYARITGLVQHYPCSFNCSETMELAVKTHYIIKKYERILPKGFENKLYAKRISSIKRVAKSIINAYYKGSFKKLLLTPEHAYNKFKSISLIKVLGLKKDFKKVISELFKTNKKAVAKMINKKMKELEMKKKIIF